MEKIEDAFGEIKGTLKTRPIFHWTDGSIVGHLTLCFISYFCEAQITRLLRQKGIKLQSSAIDRKVIKERSLTVAEAIKELGEVRAVPVKLKGRTIWVRSDIKGNVAKLFKAIGASIPPKLLKII